LDVSKIPPVILNGYEKTSLRQGSIRELHTSFNLFADQVSHEKRPSYLPYPPWVGWRDNCRKLLIRLPTGMRFGKCRIAFAATQFLRQLAKVQADVALVFSMGNRWLPHRTTGSWSHELAADRRDGMKERNSGIWERRPGLAWEVSGWRLRSEHLYIDRSTRILLQHRGDWPF
jgi:hypothetical protein